jgi:putative transferase (TIGR04331 family)
MFLATTADQRFWKKDEKILFLGEWCKIYDQRHIWSKLDSEVLPYHWDNREQLHQDFLLLQGVYERYLKLIAEQLNEIHQVDRSIRYWRIIIGYWLFHFIPILYDRYKSVCTAARSGKVTNTWIMPPSLGGMTARDFDNFVEFFLSDEYNQYLYSELITALGQIPFEVVEPEFAPAQIQEPEFNGSWTHKLARQLLWGYAEYVPGRLNKVIFIENGSLATTAKLELALGQFPYLFPRRVTPPKLEVDHSIRKRLMLRAARNEFESLLDKFIPAHIPTTYLEGYEEMHQRSLESLPKRPAVIVTANAFSGNEAFKFWAAHQVEQKARLCIVQHGGHYGSGLWSAVEEHEIEISDRFYTWGWRKQGEKRTVPLPAVKLRRFDGVKPDPSGGILWVQMSMPRYSYFMYSVPVGPQTIAYFAEQRQFLESLSPAARELLLLRLYPQNYGWNDGNRWKGIDPALKLYQGREPIQAHLSQSRLAINTYNATTFLETLSANFPTIIFWNPRHWELRPTAQPFFDELSRVGIFHDTPESAAGKVNAIYEDVLSWWHEPELQAVKDRFCREFAGTGPGWLTAWKKELAEQTRG